MSSRYPIGDARLAILLETAAQRVEFPPTPPLAAAVMTRIERQQATATPTRVVERRWFRPALVAVTLVLAVAASLALSADARRAVADLLGVVGIEISFDDEGATRQVPRTGGSPDVSSLRLGTRVDADEVATLADLELRGPKAFSGEVEIYFDPQVGETGMASTLVRHDDGDRGFLLVTEFRASINEEIVKKLAGSGTDIRSVELSRGVRAYWLSGAPHFFGYLEADGVVREETVRLAGDVLLWTEAGITYRVEGARSLRQAVRIAERLGF